jgi:hypothetical protein
LDNITWLRYLVFPKIIDQCKDEMIEENDEAKGELIMFLLANIASLIILIRQNAWREF